MNTIFPISTFVRVDRIAKDDVPISGKGLFAYLSGKYFDEIIKCVYFAAQKNSYKIVISLLLTTPYQRIYGMHINFSRGP